MSDPNDIVAGANDTMAGANDAMAGANDAVAGSGNILEDVKNRAVQVVLTSAVSGIVGAVLGPGFIATCIAGVIGSYAYGSSSGSSEAENPTHKIKGRGGAPSKKFGRPSGKGRDNNPPRNKKG